MSHDENTRTRVRSNIAAELAQIEPHERGRTCREALALVTPRDPPREDHEDESPFVRDGTAGMTPGQIAHVVGDASGQWRESDPKRVAKARELAEWALERARNADEAERLLAVIVRTATCLHAAHETCSICEARAYLQRRGLLREGA